MKNILGLDLGTNSIGWAYVKEAENDSEISSIEKIGVRVNPLTTDEQLNFEKGKPITTNASRTLARSARRNLQRYKLRRDNLIQVLKDYNWINDKSILSENGNQTTFETYKLRNLAVLQQLDLEQLARVFLMINKKRGYKSSRKVNNSEEGQLIDGMDIAKMLYNENLTPGQYVLTILREGKKKIPEFYRSDLLNEFNKIWNFQSKYYSQILTNNLKEEISGKGKNATWAILKEPFNLVGVKRDKNREEQKIENYQWRNDALNTQLDLEQLAIVFQEINGQLTNSSGYLGAISDRSKELYFNKQTVGQYLYNQLKNNSHARLKNQVFYRQDYLDEFEKIWEVQANGRENIFTDELKVKLRDITIFYQRKLKSQKGLISFCEFEQKAIEIKGKKKVIGAKVIAKSNPLFQEFKIWQNIHNIRLKNKNTKEVFELNQEQKDLLFQELNLKGNLPASAVIKLIEDKPKDWEINYTSIEGNKTNQVLYNTFLSILDLEGYDIKSELKLKLNKDDIELSDLDTSAADIKQMITKIFNHLNISTKILEFNPLIDDDAFQQQDAYQLWHLIYSYEEDDSPTGMDKLYHLLQQKFGFQLEHAKLFGQLNFTGDYGNLSAKAIRKIFPFIRENKYSDACILAGYNHSKNSFTKEEIEKRELKDYLEILPKNALRNPVVEKIINQMINVVNILIESENDNLEKQGLPRDFRFDEIKIELARELKKNAKERDELTRAINTAKLEHEKIIKILQKEDGIKFPSRNDIIRYKLYQELKNNGYKDLYSNEYIKRDELFTNKYDIEHIIPKSRLFDDSFSNKTLVPRQINLNKGNATAIDYISTNFNQEELDNYKARVENLFSQKEGSISKSKYKKLLMKGVEIGEGFIERDLRDSQYIAKKAKEILFDITKTVISTTGSITDRLRQDWGLVNVMKELNLPKYEGAGLVEVQYDKNNQPKKVINDWSKRNDHRHHAMDALTVAFTKYNHIQYLNNLNARKDDNSKIKSNILGIELNETIIVKDNKGNSKRIFREPIPNFRQLAKEHLESVLVSHKAKNKVVTRNKNKVKGSDKLQIVLTPRGQMHDQTVYGKNWWSRIELSKKVSKIEIESIIDLKKKEFIQNFIKEKGSIAKAFTDENLSKLVYNEKLLNEVEVSIPCYTQKLDLGKVMTDLQKSNSAKEKNIKNILDLKVREKVNERLLKFNGDYKKAFSDLEQNPIWLNKDNEIAIKRVTISGVKNAEALHHKKNHLRDNILDENNNLIPIDFVSTGNNHHVAIHEDAEGKLHEHVISFFEAVERVNQGLPIIDKQFNQHIGWKFLFSMKQNEMFVFPSDGFNPNEIDLMDRKNFSIISPNLFRVQSISAINYGNSIVRDFKFRHHLETSVNDIKSLQTITYQQIKSLEPLRSIIKVRLNHLGEIIHVGEY